MRGYSFIGCFILCLLAALAYGQKRDSLPKLYPSNLTAYDLENGMPISCVSDGVLDRQGRLWFNACYDQPEHQTINFFQYDGRRSELIFLDSLPPGAEQAQAALAGITETGELYGFFRSVCPYFFLFNPETHQTRYFRIANAEAFIFWMTYSAEQGLLVGAQTPGSLQVYRLQEEKPRLLFEHRNGDLGTNPDRQSSFLPWYHVLAGEELWCYAKPNTNFIPNEVRQQFRLLRFNLRDRALQVYTYDHLFGNIPPTGDLPFHQFILCADAQNQVLLLDVNRLYQIDHKTGKASLKAVFDSQFKTDYDSRAGYRVQKDAVGNLLFVLPDRQDFYRGILLDTAGRYFDYSRILQQTAALSRFGQIQQKNFQSRNFGRNILAFSAGGVVAADIKFHGAIASLLKGKPTRAIHEWRPDQYMVRLESQANFALVSHPDTGSDPRLFFDNLPKGRDIFASSLADLVKTADGYWWYGHYDTLIRIDSQKEWKLLPVSTPFFKLTFVNAQLAAIVGENGELFFYDVAGQQRLSRMEDGKPLILPGVINQLHSYGDSVLWIAGLQGLWKVPLKEGRTRKIGYPEGFRDERIMCIAEDAAGRLWLGTYGSGLHIYDPQSGTVQVIDVEKGLSNNTVVGILEDADGDMWLSTYKGVNLLSPAGEVRAQLFEEDGLSTNEFNRYSYFRDSKGRMIFGSIHGINILEPKVLKAQLPQSGELQLYLTSVSYYDARQGANQTRFHNFNQMSVIALPATHRYLNLNFALSSLIRPEDQTFFYKIERPNQKQAGEWIYLGNKPQLSLLDLSPGDHVILIRGVDYRGNRADAPIVLTVHVGRFFYQETWFYLLCFLLAAGAAAYWIYRQRVLRKNLEKELAARTHEIMDTRDQLIAQEKLASLGQMVAGIAHEIKNPLNFINNFSEGSGELVAELREELNRFQAEPDAATYERILAILDDLELNSVDVVNYGKQADRIVKSMMDHARGTSGQRIPADINKLVEDTINLAYHGFRAIHPAFQAHMEKDLDPTLEPLEVFPQELGRVLLNILNNACFAVNEKQKNLGKDYHPAIHISTAREHDEVVIRIRDNGPGIPEQVREKIFQPFFTTKPTGEGNTGLGLSISYDIITLQHKGKLLADSQPGAFTAFEIRLPMR